LSFVFHSNAAEDMVVKFNDRNARDNIAGNYAMRTG